MYRTPTGLAFTGVAATQFGGWGLLLITAGVVALFAVSVRTRFRRGKPATEA